MTIGFSVVFSDLLVRRRGTRPSATWPHQADPVLRAGLRRLRRHGRLLHHPRHHAGQPARDGTAQAAPPQPAAHVDADGRRLRQRHDHRRAFRSSSCWWSAASATACTARATCCPSLVARRGHAQLHGAWGWASARWCPTPTPPGPIVSLVFFILVALSGLCFPITPGSGLATFADFFPIRHLITRWWTRSTGIPDAVDPGTTCSWSRSGASVGVFVGLRRWEWSPKRG